MNFAKKLSKTLCDNRRARTMAYLTITFAAAMCFFSTPAYAATSDPFGALGNLVDLLFKAFKFVGVIATLFGLVWFFISFSSHDSQQRNTGIFCVIGGIFIFFIKEMLALIGVAV